MTLFAKVLILFVIVCLPQIRTELGEPKVSRNNERIGTNSTNTSTPCHFHISESSLKNVLKLMQNRKTNAIKLGLWIESVNDTMTLVNKNRVPTDMLWVNELGRTLYSLKLETKQYMKSLISYLPDVTLTAGFRDVNIVVSEDNEKCLLSKNNTMDDAIFDVLLRQLDSVSDIKTDYQFCHTYNLALNCCRIFPGDKNIRICSYYSSLVSHFYPIITVTIFALYLAFPVMVDYLSRFKENDYYTISNSPMALSYIFYVIFFKGQSQGQSERQSRRKSFGRKLSIATFVLVTWLPLRNIDLNSIMSSPISYVSQYILFVLWSPIFVFVDMYGFNVFHKSDFGWKSIGDSPLEIITFPFHLKKLWRKVKQIFHDYLSSNLNSTPKCFILSNLNKESAPQITGHGNGEDEEHSSQRCSMSECIITLSNLNEESPQCTEHGNGEDEEHSSQHCWPKKVCQYFKKCTKGISIFILIFFYLGLAFPFSCVLTLIFLFYCIWKFYKQSEEKPKVKSCRHIIWHTICHIGSLVFGIFVFGLLVYCSTQFFGSMVLFAIGVFLNGETYINYFLPLSTILFFSWTNWKSSVETKYLVLNTCIYEVCKDNRPLEPKAFANSGKELSEYAAPVESEVGIDNFDIKLNDDGEPVISPKLYHSVRKKFLPYRRVLFYYFIGIFFVTVFAYFLYTMMSLSEDSGVTSTVQILGSMAATALPIIFNLVWKHNSDEQKEANAIALKSKLRRFLKVCCLNENNEEFKVELKM